MTLRFDPLDERPGLAVIDRFERQRYRIHTPAAVEPSAVGTETFEMPVEDAVQFQTDAVVLPTPVPVYARDGDANMVAEVEQFETASLPSGVYSLDLCTQIKSYLRVDGPVEVAVDIHQTRIEFDGPTSVMLGSRPRHDRPKATVTTTDDPVDVMVAVETFGSALKTTSPERSFPTLRGHPPALELGEELAVPSRLDRPASGVTLEVPPRLDTVFVAAPLSYYLGARLVPSSTPRLRTDTGFETSLDTPRDFETSVERTLKQLFFLDCVTRTEGYYEIDLHERAAIEPHVDLDFAHLYDQPLAERVAAYLAVPYEDIEPHLPEWRLTAHVEPQPENAEQLPFVVDDLAIVRSHTDTRQPQATPPAETTDALAREDVVTRSTSTDTGPDAHEYVEPESEQTLEQAWVGERIPVGASKLTVDAFEHRLDRDATDGDISITVVQNDDRMDEERRITDAVYGSRDDLPFEATVHEDLTTDALADVLRSQTDFFHYIGHTDREGFTCRDGTVDVATLDDVGVDTFLLNACNSYHQGLGLVENGAIGGIVTLNEVVNDEAVRIGGTIARLLNGGFPLRAALDIARDVSVFGGQYIVVGDGGITVTQPASGTPNLLEVQPMPEREQFEVTMYTYSTDDRGMGSVIMPFIEGNDDYYLSSGEIDTFSVDSAELMQFFGLENVPVRIGDELHWSSSIQLADIQKSQWTTDR